MNAQDHNQRVVQRSRYAKLSSGLVYIAACFLLFILSAYRGFEVGTDVLKYQISYEAIQYGGRLYSEPLWIFLLQIVNYLGGDFRDVLVVTSSFILIPVFWGIYKESKSPMLSLFFYCSLYFYFYSFNIMRQSIALSLVFLGIICLLNSKKKYFVVLVIIAGFFHYTAFIALGLLLISHISQNKIMYLPAIFLSYVIGLFFWDSVLQLTTFVFFNYSHIAIEEEPASFWGNAVFLLFLNTFFLYVLAVVKKKDLLFNIFFVFIVMSNVLSRFPYSGRLIMYFSIIQILFLPSFIYDKKVRLKGAMDVFVIILYALVIFFERFGHGDIFPYENILF